MFDTLVFVPFVSNPNSQLPQFFTEDLVDGAVPRQGVFQMTRPSYGVLKEFPNMKVVKMVGIN